MSQQQQATGSDRHIGVLSDEETRVVHTVLAALRRVRFGSVHVVVQDGRVVQIETTEKTRLTQ